MIRRSLNRRAGSVCVLAVILLTVFAAIAAAFAAVTSINARKSGNLAGLQEARLASESGLAFGTRLIRGVRLPPGTDSGTVMAALGPALAAKAEGTGNLAGASVLYDDTRILIPRVRTDDGAFDIAIIRAADGTLSMQVTGLAEQARASLSVDLVVAAASHTVFDYGIASGGPITLDGNAAILSTGTSTNASIVSTVEEGLAVSIGGNATVGGDIFSVGADTSVALDGTPTIAGSQDPEVIAQHIHFGVDPPVFPVVDTSCFRDLATNVIDGNTDTSQSGLEFSNVVIKAGTNPTFDGDVVFNGVVYVEAPNIVNFAGKVTLNGVLATDDSDFDLESCKVSFAGQVEALGVETLPADPDYLAIKALTGTFIAAPGFDVSFAGQFSAINGTIAADRLTFSGQAEGTVNGSLIGLSGEAVSINGQVSISMDSSGGDGDDAGFSIPMVLDVVPRTYTEVIIAD